MVTSNKFDTDEWSTEVSIKCYQCKHRNINGLVPCQKETGFEKYKRLYGEASHERGTFSRQKVYKGKRF